MAGISDGATECNRAIVAGLLSTSLKLTDPNEVQIRKMAMIRPKSPIRLTTNAFFEAAAADGLWNQKPINR